jgi:hypothetical protein
MSINDDDNNKKKNPSSLQVNIFGSERVSGRHISCLFYLTRVDRSENKKNTLLYLVCQKMPYNIYVPVLYMT